LETGDQRERAAPAENARPGAVGGRGSASAADIDAYKSAIVSRINATKRYPEEARSRGAHGVAVVTFSIDAAGHVGAASVQRSTGDAGLDSDALATVRRAAPYPPPPPGAPRLYTTALNYRQP
jgi:TonB family protein